MGLFDKKDDAKKVKVGAIKVEGKAADKLKEAIEEIIGDNLNKPYITYHKDGWRLSVHKDDDKSDEELIKSGVDIMLHYIEMAIMNATILDKVLGVRADSIGDFLIDSMIDLSAKYLSLDKDQLMPLVGVAEKVTAKVLRVLDEEKAKFKAEASSCEPTEESEAKDE